MAVVGRVPFELDDAMFDVTRAMFCIWTTFAVFGEIGCVNVLLPLVDDDRLVVVGVTDSRLDVPCIKLICELVARSVDLSRLSSFLKRSDNLSLGALILDELELPGRGTRALEACRGHQG